jgi:hypothetical protein
MKKPFIKLYLVKYFTQKVITKRSKRLLSNLIFDIIVIIPRISPLHYDQLQEQSKHQENQQEEKLQESLLVLKQLVNQPQSLIHDQERKHIVLGQEQLHEEKFENLKKGQTC